MKSQSKFAALLAAGFIFGTVGVSFAQAPPPPATGTPAGPVPGTNPTTVGTGDSQTKTGTGDRPSADTTGGSQTSAPSTSGKKKHSRHGKKSQPNTSATTSANGSAAKTTQ